MNLKHPWEPEYSKNSKLLILGTFPSPKSREMGYYYGHPQNVFWKTLAASLGVPEPPYEVEARQRFVREHGVALWDVFKSVNIDGASDASIHEAEPNTFKKIITGSEIKTIFTTGRTGTEAFNRLRSGEAGMRAVYLPSTSPANRKTQATPDYDLRWSLIGKLIRGELVSSAGMKELDRKTIEGGVPSLVLMEKAALSVAYAIRDGAFAKRPRGSEKVLCVCGAGNNGGDGFAAARLLENEGIASEILFIGDSSKMSKETKHQARAAKGCGIPVSENDLSKITKHKIIVDALFGIGLTRELSGMYLDTVKTINKARKSGAYVLAVDVPSGLSADTGEALGGAVTADETVTFAYSKIGLTIGKGVECSGKLKVADIGIYR